MSFRKNGMIHLAFAIAFLGMAPAFAAENLSLDSYLNQVSEGSPALRAAEALVEGHTLLDAGTDLLTTPYAFGNYTNFDDRQETTNPAFSGNRTQSNQYTVGVGMNTPIGLNAKYTFNTADIELYGVSPTFVPLPRFNTSYNKIELTQSLVKNGFGSETRAKVEALEAANQAAIFGNRYAALAQLVRAESAYWRLALARRAIDIRKDALSRAQRALDWARKRVNMQLGDKSDLLQAQAAYDLRQMDLINAQEEEKNAARAFNNLRNRDNDLVSESLQLPSIEETLRRAKVEKSGTRLDIKAAEEETRALIAQAQIERESVKPSLDLFANIAWNGRDAERSPAVKEAFRSNHSTTSFGITFSTPLSLGSVRDSLRGSELIKENAALSLDQRKLDEKLAWSEIVGDFDEARTRLNLLRTIENVQREKYENERQRLLRGRTTTYQSLAFEQDYATSQLMTLQTQVQVLQILAQMKLYRGEQ